MQLDARIETFLLLMTSQWGEDEKVEVVKELDSLGVDGQDFFNRYFKVVEKYYATFQRQKVDSSGAQLLQGMDVVLLTVYLSVFIDHPDWFDTIGSLSDDEVFAAVDSVLGELADSSFGGSSGSPSESTSGSLRESSHGDGDIIASLESMGLGSDTKWQIMVLKQFPKKQLEMVAQAVRDNLSAFEKAWSKVDKELTALLEHADRIMSDPNKARIIQILHNISPKARIVPTLALPVSIMVFDDVAIYGLLSDRIAQGSAGFSREELIIGAKALSEKSKLEILMALKEGSLYSMEIAEKVGLTPATISHHMNVLLLTGFVELEKREGKAYYQLSPRGIERFLTGVGKLLL